MRGKRKGKKRVASWCGGGHVTARGVGGFEPSDGDRTARGGWEEGFRLGGRFFSLFSPLVFLGLFGIGRHRVIFAFSTSHRFTVVKLNFNCSFHRVLLCLLINFSLFFET